MKKLIISLTLLITFNIYSQYNHVRNNGFENVKSFSPSLTWGCDGEIDQCYFWNTRTVKYISNCGSICGMTDVAEHSPDLIGRDNFCGYNPQYVFKGNFSLGAGATNAEIFQQEFEKKLRIRNYRFSGFIKPFYLGTGFQNEILTLDLHDDFLEFDCENDCDALRSNDDCYYEYSCGIGKTCPKSSYDYNFDNRCISAKNTIVWNQFNFKFTPNEEDLSHFNVRYHGLYKNQKQYCGELAEYSYFDELSIQPYACSCLDDLWVENQTLKTNDVLQANKNLRLGYNVDNVTPNGNIIVDGKNIIVRAGESISLEPGIEYRPGYEIDYKIEPCQFKAENKIPSLLFKSNAVYERATNPLNRNFVIGVDNATDYYIEFYDRWGEKIGAEAGEIAANNITLIYPPYDRIPHDQVIVFQMWLYNCGDFNSFHHDDLVVFKSTKNEISTTTKLFPNPTSGEFNIELNLLEDSNNISINLLDFNGRILNNIVKNENFKKGVHNIRYDGSVLSSGEYLINIYNQNKLYECLKLQKR